MKIVSLTLYRDNASIIEEALRSVIDWVDHCIIIDTGSKDDTLDVARQVTGKKGILTHFEWREDFAAARNYALDWATTLKADWAVMLDTDERILLNGEDLRATLAEAHGDAILMGDQFETYAKERCFRLPILKRFTGPTHECFPYAAGRIICQKARFQELPKTKEQQQYKFERDVVLLERHTAIHPTDPRWRFYLGESLKNLERYEEAIFAYDECASLYGWDEEAAWACYRSAECHVARGHYRKAIDRCATGLARHAGIAELAWLAGYCAYQLKNWAQAVYWSRLALTHGLYEKRYDAVPRIGFRNPKALYEGPYDILRFALRNLGDVQGADVAEHTYLDALSKRVEKIR